MADDTKAQTVPETTTQDAPMPSAEQKTAEPTDADTTGPAEREEAASTQPEGEALPESASERTREQFEKIRNDLREERTRREYLETVYQSMQPKEPAQPPMTPIYDPDTGLLNEQGLTDIQQKAIQAEQRAARAEAAIQSYLNEQENRDTFAAYPELDPNNKKTFNKDLHVSTRQILLDSMLNPQDYKGKQLSFKEAAALAKSHVPGSLEAAKKEGAQQAMEQLTPKEQASLDAVGSPSRRGDVLNDLDDLRKRTRKGDPRASIERMKRILGQE